MATPRKRPLEDVQQFYAYVWKLGGRVVLVGYGRNNRGRPTCKSSWTGRSVACVAMLIINSQRIAWSVVPCSSKEEAQAKERALIAEFKPKYNTAPGCGGWKGMHTKQGLSNIRAAHLGTKLSLVTRSKMSAKLMGNQHLKGHKHSEATKEKIAAGNRGRSPSELCRKKARERMIDRNKNNPPRKRKEFNAQF